MPLQETVAALGWWGAGSSSRYGAATVYLATSWGAHAYFWAHWLLHCESHDGLMLKLAQCASIAWQDAAPCTPCASAAACRRLLASSSVASFQRVACCDSL
jgi:hypothetical protein